MSLRDDLDAIIMDQTREYNEEAPDLATHASERTDVNSVNGEILGGKGVQLSGNSAKRRTRTDPFKKHRNKDESSDDGGFGDVRDVKKIFLFAGGSVILVILVVLFYFGYQVITADKGADFYQDMEDGEAVLFKYTMDERETLRINGYTADDIERFEAEESNPYDLVVEAEYGRKALYDKEIKPYLDGASDKFKELQLLTWLGTGDMSPSILTNAEGSYEEHYGTYNCDYVKIPAMGSQLFLKLELIDFNTTIFMTITAQRYNELKDSGNIVVVIDYNKYQDESILVTNVQEKNIKN